MNQAVKWTAQKLTAQKLTAQKSTAQKLTGHKLTALNPKSLRNIALAVFVAGGAFGCETPVKPTPAAPAPSFVLPPTRGAAVAQLKPAVGKFNNDIAMFPGVTGAEHRQTLAIALDDLGRILRLINGHDLSPGFTTDLAIITSARNTASMQSIPRDRMIGVENQALQATYTALNELSTRYLLDKDVLPGLLDTLNAKVTNAAGVTGTMHDLDATDCFNAVGAVVNQMTRDLAAMVPADQTPMPVPPEMPTPPAPTAPVTPPTSTPTSAPAPTTVPAPMPTPTPTP